MAAEEGDTQMSAGETKSSSSTGPTTISEPSFVQSAAAKKEGRLTAQLKDAMEMDRNVQIDEFRSKEKMRKLYLRRLSTVRNIAAKRQLITIFRQKRTQDGSSQRNVTPAPFCACGNNLDLTSSAYTFGLNKQARSSSTATSEANCTRPWLLNHNPMVLKIYYDYCQQLSVRPSSGFVGLVSCGRGVGIGCFCALRELKLRNFGICDAGLVPIVRLLTLAKTLEVLDVSENFISDAGVSLLIEMPKTQPSFMSLNLENNHKVSTRSFRPLLRMLQTTPQVTTLVVEGTSLLKADKDVLYYQMLWNRQKVLNGAIPKTREEKRKAREEKRSQRRTQEAENESQNPEDKLPQLALSDGKQISIPSVRLKKEVQRLETLMNRFKLLTIPRDENNNVQWDKAEQLIQDPLYAGPPDSLDEDCWERQKSFEAAQRLYHHWKMQRQIIIQEDAEKELAVKKRIRREKKRQVYSRWGIFARWAHDMGHEHQEVELWRMLRMELPHTKEDMEFAIKKLEGLISKLEGTPCTILPEGKIEEARALLKELRVNLSHLTKHLKLFKIVSHVSTFVGMNRKQIEDEINKRLKMGETLMDLSDDKLQVLADDLHQLVDRGVQISVHEELLNAAEELSHSALERIVLKKRVRKKVDVVRNSVLSLNKTIAGLAGVREVVEADLEDMIAKGANWFITMALEELIEYSNELQTLADSIRRRFHDLDVEPAEELLREIGRYLASVNDDEEEMEAIIRSVDEMLLTCGFTTKESQLERYIQLLYEELHKVDALLEKHGFGYDENTLLSEQVGKVHRKEGESEDKDNTEKGLKDGPVVHEGEEEDKDGIIKGFEDGPAGRSGRGFNSHVLFGLHHSLTQGITALERGPDFFGLHRLDKYHGVSCNQLFPLWDAIEALEESCSDEGTSLQMLVQFHQTIKRYGYSSMSKAMEALDFHKGEEESEVTIERLEKLLEKIGVHDKCLIEYLYGLVTPFSPCNLRRLLSSSVVFPHVETGDVSAMQKALAEGLKHSPRKSHDSQHGSRNYSEELLQSCGGQSASYGEQKQALVGLGLISPTLPQGSQKTPQGSPLSKRLSQGLANNQQTGI